MGSQEFAWLVSDPRRMPDTGETGPRQFGRTHSAALTRLEPPDWSRSVDAIRHRALRRARTLRENIGHADATPEMSGGLIAGLDDIAVVVTGPRGEIKIFGAPRLLLENATT